MTQSKPDARPLAPLALPFYLVAFTMVALSLVQVASSIGSLQPSVLRWRFGAVGLMSGSVPSLVFGTFLFVAAAAFFQHRWALRVFSVLAGLASLAFLGLVVMFVLDTLQLKGQVQDAALRAYYLASGRALLALGLGFVVMGAISFGGFRIRGPKKAKRAPAVAGVDTSLLVARAPTNS